jgi:CRP-like cAMP-binding protein
MTNAIQALQQTALFGNLEMPDLQALSSRAVERTLKKGEILFLAGDAADGLYVVVKGAIRAYRVGADGREQVIHVERSGSTLAEVPVFDGGLYPSTTAAEEDSSLLFIRKEDVVQLCLDRPVISLAALKLLARRLRNCAAMIENLSLRDVDRRLAQLLADESADYAHRHGDSIEFELSLTHQQIAARIGSVREVVSRAFTRLQQSGLVQAKGRRIVVPSEKALRAFVAE